MEGTEMGRRSEQLLAVPSGRRSPVGKRGLGREAHAAAGGEHEQASRSPCRRAFASRARPVLTTRWPRRLKAEAKGAEEERGKNTEAKISNRRKQRQQRGNWVG